MEGKRPKLIILTVSNQKPYMVSLEFMGKNETNIICFQYYCTFIYSNNCIDHVCNLYSKIRVKKEVATVAGIPQDKPNSSIENNKESPRKNNIETPQPAQ